MSKFHRLNSDIETLRKVIDEDWAELALADMTSEQATKTLRHLQACNRTLKSLVARRDQRAA